MRFLSRRLENMVQYGVLANGSRQGLSVEIIYNDGQTWTIPTAVLSPSERARIRNHWELESPGLTDGNTIVHVAQIDVDWTRVKVQASPTTFFEFVHSNYSVDEPLLKRGSSLRARMCVSSLGGVRPGGVACIGHTYKLASLGNTLGFNCSVITRDNYAITAVRSSTGGMARDKGTRSVICGSQFRRDIAACFNDGRPSLGAAIQVALRQEIGEELFELCSDVSIVEAGFELRWCHPEFQALVAVDCTAQQFVAKWWATSIPHRREYQSIDRLDLTDPSNVMKYVLDPDNKFTDQQAAAILLACASINGENYQVISTSGYPLQD